MRSAYKYEIAGRREFVVHKREMLRGWERSLRQLVPWDEEPGSSTDQNPVGLRLQDTRARDHLLRMEKLFKLEAVTLDQMLQAAAVRATDGCISQLIWENTDRSRTNDLFVWVPEVMPEHVDPVRRQIGQLLVDAQGTHGEALSTRP